MLSKLHQATLLQKMLSKWSQPALTKRQNQALSKRQKQALSKRHQPGSTTLIGISAEDRYRITYEARQLLHNVYASQDQEIIGSVGKGLLVVPGEWARLSNISESGTWLSDESFKVGGKVITRTQGSSAGRIMLPYRRLRQSHPELMSKIEIMQQPAANDPQLEHPGSGFSVPCIHLDERLLLLSVQ